MMSRTVKTGNKTITVADNAGFCFGVKRAINMAENAASNRQDQVYSMGPLIHNDRVIQDLEDKGIKAINSLDDLKKGKIKTAAGEYKITETPINALPEDPADRCASEAKIDRQTGTESYGDDLTRNDFSKNDFRAFGDDLNENPVVIVRSHGESKKFYEKASEMNVQIVDATCPVVEKIHKLVHEAAARVMIVGDASHPEVQGIAGWCREEISAPAVILSSYEEAAAWADSIQSPEKGEGKTKTGSSNSGKMPEIFIVTQTTIREDILNDVLKALDERNISYELHNTICSATSKRQESCRRLAEQSELMLVVGDKKSSNTRKLFEIASKYCRNTFFVENPEDLPLREVAKCNKIGLAAGASTPERTIKEVIANMSDTTLEKELTMDDLMPDIDKSLRLPRNGEIVNGKVHQVNDEEVIVNLGCKKDGILPASEVNLEEGQTLTDLFKEGDDVQAKVVKTDDAEGGILLSKKKLEISKNWGEILKAYEDKTIIEVKVVRTVNGGVIANYKEVSGFIPLSQLSDHYVEDASEFVGQTLEVKVTRVDQRRNRVVFSHKQYLLEEKEKLVAEIWENLHVDDVVEGTVMRFTDYGAFVDIGGIDGLLHISEISWGKLRHPQEALSIGEKINVKVLSMNQEKGKISLGLKQNTPEPWSVIDDNYEVGQVIEGKIVQIKEYGAFVELEPGLDGLVHISEVAHKRVANINDELETGQIVKAKILDIDKDRRRISLSIRETIDPNAPEPETEAPEPEEAPAEEPADNAAAAETADTVDTAEAPAEEAANEAADTEAAADTEVAE